MSAGSAWSSLGMATLAAVDLETHKDRCRPCPRPPLSSQAPWNKKHIVFQSWAAHWRGENLCLNVEVQYTSGGLQLLLPFLWFGPCLSSSWLQDTLTTDGSSMVSGASVPCRWYSVAWGLLAQSQVRERSLKPALAMVTDHVRRGWWKPKKQAARALQGGRLEDEKTLLTLPGVNLTILGWS